MLIVRKPFRCASLLSLVLSLLVCGNTGEDSLQARSDYFAKVAEFANATTVGLYCRRGELMSYYGTGVVITRDGYILTSTTVVPEDAEDIKVFLNTHEIYEGTLIETNDAAESALIKILPDKLLKAVSFAEELPAIGERAYTLGNAHSMLRKGEQGSFSVGVISGLYPVESTDSQSSYSGLAIETDAAINPGQDGGMLLNSRGQLVGIVSLSYSTARWQGVAVPITKIRDSLDYLKTGKIKVATKAEFDPLPGDGPASLGVAGVARGVARCLVSLEVQREHPAEVLPRTGMDEFLDSLPESISELRRQALLSAYSNSDQLLATNQQVRRPATPVTGTIISADGYILTSTFNVEADEVWLKDGKVVPPEFDETYFLKNDYSGYLKARNPVRDIYANLPNGERLKAKLVSRHVPLGIALLKVEAKDLPFVTFEDMKKDDIAVGAPCAVVGVSDGPKKYTLNTGMISAEKRYRNRRFQFDAIVNYGNSGGPVLGEGGQLLGVALAPMEPGPTMGRFWSNQDVLRWQIAPNSGVSLSARADLIAGALKDMKDGKSILKMSGPFVGISPDDKHILGKQVRLAHVQKGSPADKAGMDVGDILVSFNGRTIVSWKDLTDELDGLNIGDTVKVVVLRKSRQRYLLLNGKKVGNAKELNDAMRTFKDGDAIVGKYVDKSDQTLELSLILGERK